MVILFKAQRNTKDFVSGELPAECMKADDGHWLTAPGVEKLMHVPQLDAEFERSTILSDQISIEDSNLRAYSTRVISNTEDAFSN